MEEFTYGLEGEVLSHTLEDGEPCETPGREDIVVSTRLREKDEVAKDEVPHV